MTRIIDPADVETYTQGKRILKRWAKLLEGIQVGDSIIFTPIDVQSATQVRSAIQGLSYRLYLDRYEFKTRIDGDELRVTRTL